MDKKEIAILAACVILLIVWFPLMQRVGWMPSRAKAPAKSAVAAAAKPGTVAPADTAITAPAAGTAAETELKAGPAETQVAAPAATAERISFGQSDDCTLEIDTGSGGAASVTLHRYLEDDRQRQVTLGQPESPLGGLVFDPMPAALPPATVVVHDPERLVLERQLPAAGVTIRQEWRMLAAKPYQFNYALTLVNAGSAPVKYDRIGVCAGSLGLPPGRSEGGLGMPVDLAVDVALAGETRAKSYPPKKIMKLDLQDREQLAQRALNWVAVHSKYFVFLVSGGTSGKLPGCTLECVGDPGSGQKVKAVIDYPALTLQPGQEFRQELVFYAGPKEYNRLQAFGSGLESILQMDLFFFWNPDWMGSVSRVILKSLIWIKEKINRPWGFGMAIILITVFIKFLFWPLTHYSTISMKKLQVVQPLILEIREKYKGDPAKMQQKIMQVYKDNKVNPVSGCVPMLLQIPVFFALFNVLRGAIELRHAGFLWATDLSMPDSLPWRPFGLPLNPLAVLMAVTMFIQQKITPSSMDPMQAKMMMFMTVFFAFLFYSMPSGLTLYWTVNQVLSIVQTLVVFRLVKDHKPVTTAVA